MNSFFDNNCSSLIQAQRCVSQENEENQNQIFCFCFSLYKWFSQVCDLTISVTSKTAEAIKYVFSLFHGHPQLQVLLQWLIIISHGLLMNAFGFLHARSNSHYFFKVKLIILFFLCPFLLRENSVWLKMPLEQSALWSSLCSTNMTLCSQQAKGWESAALGSKQPTGKQDKGRRGPKASPKTHTPNHIKQNPSLSLSALAGLLWTDQDKIFCCFENSWFKYFPLLLPGHSCITVCSFRCNRLHTFLAPQNSISKEVNNSVYSQLS